MYCIFLPPNHKKIFFSCFLISLRNFNVQTFNALAVFVCVQCGRWILHNLNLYKFIFSSSNCRFWMSIPAVFSEFQCHLQPTQNLLHTHDSVLGLFSSILLTCSDEQVPVVTTHLHDYLSFNNLLTPALLSVYLVVSYKSCRLLSLLFVLKIFVHLQYDFTWLVIKLADSSTWLIFFSTAFLYGIVFFRHGIFQL